MSYKPSRDVVEAVLTASNEGIEVKITPELMATLCEVWLENQKPKSSECDHTFNPIGTFWKLCSKCGVEERR